MAVLDNVCLVNRNLPRLSKPESRGVYAVSGDSRMEALELTCWDVCPVAGTVSFTY